jgi:hypothetical protein
MQSRQTCKIISHTPEYKTILNIKYASNLYPRPSLPPLSSNSSETLTLGTNPTVLDPLVLDMISFSEKTNQYTHLNIMEGNNKRRFESINTRSSVGAYRCTNDGSGDSSSLVHR